MQKLAEVCIRRPVFATMIVLALVVVGSASYFRLGVDRFPSVELPTVSGPHRAARRLRRGDGDPGHAEDRGSRQHRPGHHGAPLHHRPGQRQSSSSPSRSTGRRRGRPGRPRQGLERGAQPAARHPASDGLQARQRPVAGPHPRRLRQPQPARADGARRARRSRSTSSAPPGVGRGPGRRRPVARRERLGRRRPAGRLPDADHRRP